MSHFFNLSLLKSSLLYPVNGKSKSGYEILREKMIFVPSTALILEKFGVVHLILIKGI